MNMVKNMYLGFQDLGLKYESGLKYEYSLKLEHLKFLAVCSLEI